MRKTCGARGWRLQGSWLPAVCDALVAMFVFPIFSGMAMSSVNLTINIGELGLYLTSHAPVAYSQYQYLISFVPLPATALLLLHVELMNEPAQY